MPRQEKREKKVTETFCVTVIVDSRLNPTVVSDIKKQLKVVAKNLCDGSKTD